MKVCGFTIVRNAIKYGYPVEQSIRSMLPICEKIYVAVGNSDDGTLDLIKSIAPGKVEIVETVWDDSLREGGRVLAVETNKAFDSVPPGFDWCLYLQADEVLHEHDYPTINEALIKYCNDEETEGLLFNYYHFWGTYDYIGVSRNWYRHEIRIIKNSKEIRSYRDAQGFRKNNRKLRVRRIDAHIYHYGWVRPPQIMKEKSKDFSSLWHSGRVLEKIVERLDQFDYSEVKAVKEFKGKHPEVMKELIKGIDWQISVDTKKIKMPFKEYLLFVFERITGYRLFEYRNYKIG